jgi:succinyl-diaminopimelate desuccinylase
MYVTAKFHGHHYCLSKELHFDRGPRAIYEIVGKSPEFGTIGGNSDAFFIKDITDVVEIGSSISEAHTKNEFISAKDLIKLRNIYLNILNNFAKFS